ncbi:hypothetical protein KP509_21G046900 [Ceratopteris richardii]|uniref:Phototropic-responsive NPH3 family protein n=1 Tax=Ceratopteris richardii TaxID=49495 RepID=A0A8T2SCY4_CERRI|nr:hypothetical protein KP509_21G046900 [Ceratopteris richardii]
MMQSDLILDIKSGRVSPSFMALRDLKTEKTFYSSEFSHIISATLKGLTYSPNMQSDIIFNVDGVSFSLHKLPLIARSGKIRRLILEELKEEGLIVSSPAVVEFSNFPGGPETFELAMKFCYEIDFDIPISKVASLRCAAEFLEMNDEKEEESFIASIETFIAETVLKSFERSVEVLRSCEPFLQLADKVNLVNRCIDVIASKVCNEKSNLLRLAQTEGDHLSVWTDLQGEHNSATFLTSKLNQDRNSPPGTSAIARVNVAWWAEHISTLRVDLYQRVFIALKARRVAVESLAGSLMHYAQTSLKSSYAQDNGSTSASILASSKTEVFLKTKHHLDISIGGNQKFINQHQYQRAVLDTIVSLLPAEQSLFPACFLLFLLRNAITLDTTVACQLDLECRIANQFEQLSVNDLLIPTVSTHTGDAIFDVDVVQRVLENYLQRHEDKTKSEKNFNSSLDIVITSSKSEKGIIHVAETIDSYLAEIASNSNLKAATFTSLAEKMPSHARTTHDGLYKAIDMFLKAHPTLSDMERRKVCKILNYQKLSKEASLHATQNERLPVEMIVQLLHCEQMRMRNALDRDQLGQMEASNFDRNRSLYKGSDLCSPMVDTFPSLRRKNKYLKAEVERLQHQVTELQKEKSKLKEEAQKAKAAGGNSKSLLSAISRRLGRINPFLNKGRESVKYPENCLPAPRQRRHSVS